MTQSVILLSTSQYRITKEGTSEVENEGTTVRYIMSEDLKPFEAKSVKGRVPAKANMPYNQFEQFRAVPGLYEATLDYAVDSKGKAAITVTAFTFLSELNTAKVAGNGAKV